MIAGVMALISAVRSHTKSRGAWHMDKLTLRIKIDISSLRNLLRQAYQTSVRSSVRERWYL